jgi:hypothetical protein
MGIVFNAYESRRLAETDASGFAFGFFLFGMCEIVDRGYPVNGFAPITTRFGEGADFDFYTAICDVDHELSRIGNSVAFTDGLCQAIDTAVGAVVHGEIHQNISRYCPMRPQVLSKLLFVAASLSPRPRLYRKAAEVISKIIRSARKFKHFELDELISAAALVLEGAKDSFNGTNDRAIAEAVARDVNSAIENLSPFDLPALQERLTVIVRPIERIASLPMERRMEAKPLVDYLMNPVSDAFANLLPANDNSWKYLSKVSG